MCNYFIDFPRSFQLNISFHFSLTFFSTLPLITSVGAAAIKKRKFHSLRTAGEEK